LRCKSDALFSTARRNKSSILMAIAKVLGYIASSHASMRIGG
jgi:hypothetical protein